MCKGMNRSLANVLFAGVGTADAGAGAGADLGGAADKTARSIDPEEFAMLLEDATRVVIVPGYGMAVAQAQYAVRDLVNKLEKKGIEVLFGIHPVAGRMPGHMNVLLAEVDIPYDKLYDLDQINPELERTDIALVLGANDVVNPAARTEKSSPIYGMPIIDVDKAHTVVVSKRSLRAGYAGVDNPLFYLDNTLMLFGDAKQRMQEVVAAIED
jgi:NAD(P) transhydrogenase subunit beta